MFHVEHVYYVLYLILYLRVRLAEHIFHHTQARVRQSQPPPCCNLKQQEPDKVFHVEHDPNRI